MLKKQDIIDITKTGITLFLITAISALVLAVVNSYTSGIIEKNTQQKQAEAMNKVIKDAKEFLEVEIKTDATSSFYVPAKSVYEAKNENGETTGYAVLVSENGYGGEISMVVGVDNDLIVTGISIISQSETPSLGAKCTDPDFQNQFIGKTKDLTVVKNGAKNNQVDAISSATITSKAVTEGVNQAINIVEYIKGDK